ncbi:MAG: hypothetical protein ABSC46_09315 [Candidatus Limnocylindrales bacterium]
MSDWWNQADPSVVEPEAAAATPATCPWCDAPATPAATYCASCGAVMAQREELGGLVIPGVTEVDPAVQSSPVTSVVAGQSGLSSVNLVGAVGGTSAQMVVTGVLLARDHLASGRPEVRVEDLGTPSQAALDMARRLREADAAEAPAGAEGEASTGPSLPDASTRRPAPNGTEPDADEPGSSRTPYASR